MTSTNYADTVNLKFLKTNPEYLSLENHFKLEVLDNAEINRLYTLAIKTFALDFPDIVSFEDLSLCEAAKFSLADFMLDLTRQRAFIGRHWAKILKNFAAYKVQPINIYFLDELPGKGICWNGRHTLMVLYAICLYLKLDPKKVKVPVTISHFKNKFEIRDAFVSLSSDGVMPFDDIDFIHQKIYGVRTDKNTTPEWLELEQKQSYFEKNKLFLTNKKFNDINMPGAISRVNEIIDSTTYHLSETKNFADYFFVLCNSDRPVNGEEIWIMYDFFRDCRSNKPKIVVDDDYIIELANCMNKPFNGNFNPAMYYQRVKDTYIKHYRSVNGLSDKDHITGITYPWRQMAAQFLNAQLLKSGFTKVLPDIIHVMKIADKDLF